MDLNVFLPLYFVLTLLAAGVWGPTAIRFLGGISRSPCHACTSQCSSYSAGCTFKSGPHGLGGVRHTVREELTVWWRWVLGLEECTYSMEHPVWMVLVATDNTILRLRLYQTLAFVRGYGEPCGVWQCVRLWEASSTTQQLIWACVSRCDTTSMPAIAWHAAT